MSADSVSSRAMKASASAVPSRDRACPSTRASCSGRNPVTCHVPYLRRATGTCGGQPETNAGADDSAAVTQRAIAGLPAGNFGAHDAAEAEDLGVPRVEHWLGHVSRVVHGGLGIAGNAVAQETARQRPAKALGGDRNQIGRLLPGARGGGAAG